jgi:hypothetical protein
VEDRPLQPPPHHREAIQTLARTYDDVAAYVTILPPSRVLVMAGSLGETEATRLILALDPRLTASEEADWCREDRQNRATDDV